MPDQGTDRTDLPAAALAVLNGLPDPVLLIDRQRRVMFANQAAREALQISLIGRDLAHTVRHPEILTAADEVLEGMPRRCVEVTLAAPVQRIFSVEVLPLAEQGIPGDAAALLTMHDLTGARRAEEMRADFVANVSHELRSPLSAVVGLIETLKGAAREDEAARERFLDIMHKESLRMSRLIDDLLSLSRVEINEHIQPKTGIDLRQLLTNVSELLAMKAEEKGMGMAWDLPDDFPLVAGDRDELFQVFQNLIDNAIKYGAADSALGIVARHEPRLRGTGDPGVSISIVDHGDGIPAAHIPRLTERFYRVDKGRSRSMGGTGLGLAIVKHIVSRHRGHLLIDSREGQGSSFTVQLPLAPGDES